MEGQIGEVAEILLISIKSCHNEQFSVSHYILVADAFLYRRENLALKFFN